MMNEEKYEPKVTGEQSFKAIHISEYKECWMGDMIPGGVLMFSKEFRIGTREDGTKYVYQQGDTLGERKERGNGVGVLWVDGDKVQVSLGGVGPSLVLTAPEGYCRGDVSVNFT